MKTTEPSNNFSNTIMCGWSAAVSDFIFLSSFMCVVRGCLYLSEPLPSRGRVCQGDELFLHLINPFFNPTGQKAMLTADLVTQMQPL